MQRGSCRYQRRISPGIRKICQISVQLIPLVVRWNIYIPKRKKSNPVSHWQVNFLLAICIIYIHGSLLLLGICQIMQIIIRVFGIQQQTVHITEIFFERRLEKEICIPLAILMWETIPHNSTRISTFWIIKISFRTPVATFYLAI